MGKVVTDKELVYDLYRFLPEKYFVYRILCKYFYYSRAPSFTDKKALFPKPKYQMPRALYWFTIFLILCALSTATWMSVDYGLILDETKNTLCITFIFFGALYAIFELINLLLILKKKDDFLLIIVEVSIKTFAIILICIHYNQLNRGHLWQPISLTITGLIKAAIAAHISNKKVLIEE